MWDMNGLECIFDVGKELELQKEWEKTKTWNTLKGEETPSRQSTIPLQHLLLRAKYNSHRSYEIYEFTSTMSIKEIIQVFYDNPQYIVNWIRDNGYKVYSDYVKSDKKIIT